MIRSRLPPLGSTRYVLLDGGPLDLATALLVPGYVILIPLGIIWQGRDREKGA